MHHLLAVVVAEGFLDFARPQAADAGDVLGAVVGDAAGDAAARAVHDVHGVTAPELPRDAAHPGGQQAAVMLQQRGGGSLVHRHLASLGYAPLRQQIQ